MATPYHQLSPQELRFLQQKVDSKTLSNTPRRVPAEFLLSDVPPGTPPPTVPMFTGQPETESGRSLQEYLAKTDFLRRWAEGDQPTYLHQAPEEQAPPPDYTCEVPDLVSPQGPQIMAKPDYSDTFRMLAKMQMRKNKKKRREDKQYELAKNKRKKKKLMDKVDKYAQEIRDLDLGL